MGNGSREAKPAPRTAAAAILLCALGWASPACRAPVKVTPTQSAERATREKDWPMAARLWTSLYRTGGPGAAQACLEAARAEVQLARLDEACKLVDSGLEDHPDCAPLWEERGNVLELMGFRRAAEYSQGRALELDPGLDSARLARAELRLELGLASAARSDIELCLKAGQVQPEVWIAYARCLTAMGESRPAFDAYARGFELGQPEISSLVSAAAIYMGGDLRASTPRDRELVVAWLNLTAARAPQTLIAHYWLGVIQLEDGKPVEAEVNFERALAVDPQHLQSLERLAAIALERGDRERAEVLATRVLEIDPSPAKRKAMSVYLPALAIDPGD